MRTSFDAKRLPNFISYVECQKEHHIEGTTIPILERMVSANEGPRLTRDATSHYASDEDRWRDEFMVLDKESHELA